MVFSSFPTGDITRNSEFPGGMAKQEPWQGPRVFLSELGPMKLQNCLADVVCPPKKKAASKASKDETKECF